MVLSTTIMHTGALNPTSIKGRNSILDNCKIYSTEILLGILCGFVIGAKGICKKTNISSNYNDFNRAIILSSNAGIGFVIGCVGCIILNNILLGVILYVIQIITGFLLFKIQNRNFTKSDESELIIKSKRPISTSLVQAISSSTKTIITICGFNIFFTVISDLIIKIFKFEKGKLLYSLTYSIFEFSKGSFNSSYISIALLKNFIIGFCIGFGGLCTHFQIFAECEGYPLNKKNFIFIKLLQGILCGVIFGIFCQLFEKML